MAVDDQFAHVGARDGWLGSLMMLLCLAILPCNGAIAAMSRSQQVEVAQEANTAFANGTKLTKENPQQAYQAYRKAQRLFESLVADGVVNGKLYYNLGNACLKAGDLGKAILNYRRAEELLGSDSQLQANLRFARKLCRNQIAPTAEKELLQTLLFWHYRTSTASRYVVALVSFAMFWLLLAAALFVKQPGLRYGAWAMLIVWLSTGASFCSDMLDGSDMSYGVITANDVTVRKGDGDGYEPQFREAFYEGVEFSVIEKRPGWYKIELSNGEYGWIRENQAELL